MSTALHVMSNRHGAVSFTAAANGVAFVRVKHYSASKTGTYSIKVTAN